MRKVGLILTTVLLGYAASVHAALGETVVTFEDRSSFLDVLSNGYQGFSWGAATYTLDWATNGYGSTGYQFGATSGNKVAFSSDSSVSIDWLGVGKVDFVSANWTAAFQNHALSFEGWSDGVKKYDSASFEISKSTPVNIALNWLGIDRLVVKNSVSGYGYQWVMDDFTYVSAVPEPSLGLLFAFGIMSIFGFRRYQTHGHRKTVSNFELLC